MTDSPRDQIRRLAEAAEKMLSETERLRRDVGTLVRRIEPFEGELRDPGYLELGTRPRWNVVDALNLIAQGRKDIASCEFHLSAIRSRLDEISNDVVSREDMKPWLKRE